MKYFHYLREINIRDYRENYSYDGESQPYVSENRQYRVICFCDLLYKGVTGEKTRIFQ